jgi:hypothetical protein
MFLNPQLGIGGQKPSVARQLREIPLRDKDVS